MSKMKIIDEVADAQVSYIKEALYDSVEWAMSSVEEFEKLEGDTLQSCSQRYNDGNNRKITCRIR